MRAIINELNVPIVNSFWKCPKKIVLMHLSKHNNTEEKALETFFQTFKEYEMSFSDVVCAKQNEITKVCDDKDFVCR